MIDAVDRLLELALSRGAAAAEVYAEQSVTRRVKVFRGAVEELTSARRKGVGLRVFQEGSVGYAYASDLADESLREIVDMALAQSRAQTTTPTPCCRSARGAGGRRGVRPRARPGDRRAAHRPGAGRRARGARRRSPHQVGRRVGYADGDAQVFIANSGGVRGQFREGHCYAYAYVLGEQDGQIETGLSFTVGRSRPTSIPGLWRRSRDAGGGASRGDQAKDDQDNRGARPLRVASFFGVLSSALTGRSRAERPLAVCRADRRTGRRTGPSR